MDVRNIAICLAPTLLNMNNLKDANPSFSIPSSQSSFLPSSPQSSQSLLIRDHTQLMSRQCNASLECLSIMIENPRKIFQIPNEAFTKCQFTRNDYSNTLTLNELFGKYSDSMLDIYLNDRTTEMFKVKFI